MMTLSVYEVGRNPGSNRQLMFFFLGTYVHRSDFALFSFFFLVGTCCCGLQQIRDTLSIMFYVRSTYISVPICFFIFIFVAVVTTVPRIATDPPHYFVTLTHALPIYGTSHFLLFCVDFVFLDRSASARRFRFFYISVPIYMRFFYCCYSCATCNKSATCFRLSFTHVLYRVPI